MNEVFCADTRYGQAQKMQDLASVVRGNFLRHPKYDREIN